MIVKEAHFWRCILFKSENRFSIDGPDDSRYNLVDKKLPKRIFYQRFYGGGGIMVWVSISVRGSTTIVVVECKIKNVKCTDVL